MAIFLLRCNSLVGLVDILDGQDSEVAVVAEVSQSDPLTGLEAELTDLVLGQVQGDGHGKKDAIGQAVLFDDTVSRIMLDPQLSK